MTSTKRDILDCSDEENSTEEENTTQSAVLNMAIDEVVEEGQNDSVRKLTEKVLCRLNYYFEIWKSSW